MLSIFILIFCFFAAQMLDMCECLSVDGINIWTVILIFISIWLELNQRYRWRIFRVEILKWSHVNELNKIFKNFVFIFFFSFIYFEEKCFTYPKGKIYQYQKILDQATASGQSHFFTLFCCIVFEQCVFFFFFLYWLIWSFRLN